MSDYRRGFESLTDERAIDALPVEGTVPDWLEGTLVRNGPARFSVGDDDYNHWFDGQAMLRAFRIGDGRVGYRNRFLETQARRESLEQGEISRSEFATDPCRSIFQRIHSIFEPTLTDNASINVDRLAGRIVALTETPMPVAFDPETLETAGVVSYTDDLSSQATTAHPHSEVGTGRTITYTVDFGRQCRYHVCAIEPGTSRRQVLATLDVDAPSYMHSFGMTENYAILSEWPIRVRPLNLLLSGKPFIENYEWSPEQETRFRIIRLSDGEEVATCEAGPAFAFHHVNAFERGDEIVCDVAAYENAQIIDDLYLDRLRHPDRHPTRAYLRRYRLPLNGGSVSTERLAGASIELPRIDDRVEGRSYRVAYGIGASSDDAFADRLVKADVRERSATVWEEPGVHPGEPVYVPRPDATGEDEGVVLSVALDVEAERSLLLVLDAESFEERARAPVPHALPFDFHGQFL